MTAATGLAAVLLTLAACSSEQQASGAETENASAAGSTGQWETTPEGRLRFGCALQLGFADGDPGVLHYLDKIARMLFISSVEAEQTRVGATLWNTSDALVDGADPPEREQLRQVCRRNGFDASETDLDALGRYMCQINSELVRDRPTLDDFGPERTNRAPGDALRNDPRFIDATLVLLAPRVDGWEWPANSPMTGYEQDDDAEYRTGLQAVDDLCP